MGASMAIDDDGNGIITVFDPISGNPPQTVTSDHPNFKVIAARVAVGEDIDDLLSVEAAVTKIDDRVEIRDDVLHFDGQALHNNLANTIIRYHREGRDTANLVKFMELLTQNPSFNSRQQLFNWAQATDLTIDDDGYIVGYKGLRPRSEDTVEFPVADYPLESVHAGATIVDGKPHNGHTPAGPGAVIEMPRDEVNDNPNQGCSHGLHVGNWDYAKTWSEVLVEVRFSPADVVSVPADSQFQKLRCCRYEIIDIHESEDDDLYDYEPEAGVTDEDVDEILSLVIPQGFLAALRAKFRNQ